VKHRAPFRLFSSEKPQARVSPGPFNGGRCADLMLNATGSVPLIYATSPLGMAPTCQVLSEGGHDALASMKEDLQRAGSGTLRCQG
jgi:hypothetical protein